MIPLRTKLGLRDLAIRVALGCSAEERSTLQEVRLGVSFTFTDPPRACETDALADTVDYVAVADGAQFTAGTREFQTIEHLGHALFHALRTLFPESGALTLTVGKISAPVPGLLGGSWFEISDGSS